MGSGIWDLGSGTWDLGSGTWVLGSGSGNGSGEWEPGPRTKGPGPIFEVPCPTSESCIAETSCQPRTSITFTQLLPKFRQKVDRIFFTLIGPIPSPHPQPAATRPGPAAQQPRSVARTDRSGCNGVIRGPSRASGGGGSGVNNGSRDHPFPPLLRSSTGWDHHAYPDLSVRATCRCRWRGRMLTADRLVPAPLGWDYEHDYELRLRITSTKSDVRCPHGGNEPQVSSLDYEYDYEHELRLRLRLRTRSPMAVPPYSITASTSSTVTSIAGLSSQPGSAASTAAPAKAAVPAAGSSADRLNP